MPKGRCHSCEIMVIQGVRCHEPGCPEAWRDETRECDWCGRKFQPQNNRFERCCSDDCAENYMT